MSIFRNEFIISGRKKEQFFKKIYLCIYWFERKTDRKKERDRDGVRWRRGSAGSLPNDHNGWGCVRPKPGARNPIYISHVGGRGLSMWAIFHCLPRCISRELDQKTNIWGLQLILWYRMPMTQVVAWPTVLQNRLWLQVLLPIFDDNNWAVLCSMKSHARHLQPKLVLKKGAFHEFCRHETGRSPCSDKLSWRQDMIWSWEEHWHYFLHQERLDVQRIFI